MQGSCRSRLSIKCAADVKTSDAKQADAATNGKADKEPEYYEVRSAQAHACTSSVLFSNVGLVYLRTTKSIGSLFVVGYSILQAWQCKHCHAMSQWWQVPVCYPALWCLRWTSLHAQLTLQKPLGIRFTRGGDGGAYVVRSDSKIGSTDPQVEVQQLCQDSLAMRPENATEAKKNLITAWHLILNCRH